MIFTTPALTGVKLRKFLRTVACPRYPEDLGLLRDRLDSAHKARYVGALNLTPVTPALMALP
jgi:hypothetical protein